MMLPSTITISVLVLSLLAGWAVNLLADGVPQRLKLSDVLRSAPELMWLRPKRNILVFLMAVALGESAYLQAGWSLYGAVLALQAWFFLVIAVIDLEHRRVLNRMLIPSLPLILICNWLVGLPSLRSALIGALFGFGIFLLLALIWRGGMGMGDVKLAGVIGLATGLSGALIAMLVSFYAGGIAALILLIRSRKRGQTMAYAPYLSFGAWVALFWGKEILRLYASIS